VDAEAVADLRYEADPIDEFGIAVPFFLANTVRDDVILAGKPARVGFTRPLPQACLPTRSAVSARLSRATPIIVFSTSFPQIVAE
jgi:hypothetical protein